MKGKSFFRFLFKLTIPLAVIVVMTGTAYAHDRDRDEDRSGSRLATEYSGYGDREDRYNRDDGEDNDRSGSRREREGRKLEYTGTVQSISGQSWIIDGQTFEVNSRTEIEDNPIVGSLVEVEYVVSDGTSVAREIERKGEGTTTSPPVITPKPPVTEPTPPPAPTTPPPPPPPATTPSPTPALVSYSAQIQPILNACTSCHGRDGGVTLSSYSGTIATVRPGDSAGSRLYREISLGGSMRRYLPSPPEDAQLIADWIDQGARNN